MTDKELIDKIDEIWNKKETKFENFMFIVFGIGLFLTLCSGVALFFQIIGKLLLILFGIKFSSFLLLSGISIIILSYIICKINKYF